MRYNEIQKWDLKGYWITDDGRVIDVNHDKGDHHADLAFDEYADYVDWDDYSSNSDEETFSIAKDDEFARETVINAAFNDGWIRVSISPSQGSFEVFYNENATSRQTLNILRNKIQDDIEYNRYGFENSEYATFDNSKEAVRYIVKQIAKKAVK